jgi:DNA-binding winged helix-turn-helix (wHTH) protein/Tol biopolymer transport system component
MNKEAKHFYEFGPFRVDPDKRLLLRDNNPIPLQPKAFETLLVLVQHCEAVVLKDDLMKSVWPDTFVEESNLAQNIFVLRKTLGDTAGDHRYIVTIPGRGYRFTEKVRLVPETDDILLRSVTRIVVEEETEPETDFLPDGERRALPAPALGKQHWGRTLLLVLAGVIAGGLAVWALLAPQPMPKVLRSVQLTHFGRVEPDSPVLTDGSRLYFTERIGGSWSLAQVAEQGGEPTLVSTSVAAIALLDIDHSRSRLLVGAQKGPTADSFNPLWEVPTGGGSGRRLGDALGEYAAWSPDGQSIAYSQEGALFVARDDGQEPRKLFSAAQLIEYLRWSPDGKSLSFTLRSAATGARSLWEITADGHDPHPANWGWKPRPGHWGEGECCGDWSPDGKYFVFRSVHDGVASLWAVRERRDWIHKGGGLPVQLYTSPDHIGQPRFSADGKKIFFVDYQERRELVRYDSSRNLFVPYLNGIPARHLSFSRDGQWVAYKNETDGSLWRSRSDGTQALRLTFPPLEVLHSTWSPNGKSIVFGANGSLYKIPSEGGQPEALPPQGAGATQPSWSADGRSLLFVGWKMSEPEGHQSSIYLLDLSTRQIQIVPGSEGFEGPQWSPDDKYAAAADKKDRKLMLFDFARRQWSELADGIPYGWGIRWSADGRYVYYQHMHAGEEQPIFRVRLSDHRVEQITSSRQILRADVLSYSMTGLTPDDSPLASLVRRNSDVYALQLDLP